MKTKRIIALILAVILTIPLTAMANERDNELEELILSVKERVGIPKECTEFNYNMESGEGGEVYSFYWFTKDKGINIHVSAEPGGTIIDYSNYDYNGQDYSGLAKVSYEQGLKSAKDFVDQIKLPYKDGLRLSKQSSITQDRTYNYVFDDYVNGIKVKSRKVMISVDKQTGKVRSFNGPRTYKGTYDDAKAKLSLDAAKKAYTEKIGIPLVYRLYYDYEKEITVSFPAYMVYNPSYKAIDARTGEVITPYLDYNSVLRGAKKETSADVGAGNSELTPQEIEAVEETKLLISKEEAKQKAEKYFPKVKETKIQSAALYKINSEDQYVWRLLLNRENAGYDIYLSLDAMTGEVLSYLCYHYNDSGDEEKAIDEEAVKEKVESFLKNIAEEKYSLTRYKSTEQRNGYRLYEYERLENGIPVSDNGLTVDYNTYYDEITSYSNMWTKTSFKDVKGVVGEDKIADLIGLELMYIDKDKDHRVLAYAHEEMSMAFDPFTGSRISYYNGQPEYKQKTTFYDDVTGHPKEAIIKKLYDSGIVLPGKSLRPDEKINQVDFLRLVLKESNENASEKDIYEMAINREILSEDEKNPTHIITKEEAIKYIINSTAYKKVASLTEIYRYPYEDEKEVDENLKGYVALAYGLGIIEKDQTNLLNPKDSLTRAQAMQLIYNFVK